MPEVPPTSATNQPEPKPADPVVTPAPAAATKPAEEKPAETKPQDQTPGWMKAEIAGERQKRRELEAARQQIEQEREQARQEADRYKAELARLKNPPAEAQRPKRDSFEKAEDYESALVEFSVQEAARQLRDEQKSAQERREADERAARERTEQEQRERQSQDEQRKLAQTWIERRNKALETHPDFAEVAEREDLTITMPMLDAMWREENGPLIAYHLGKNPEEAKRISQLPESRQQAEIVKLSVRLEARPVSRAPNPITPVGSSDRSGPRKLEEMSMEEYAAQHASRRSRQ